MKQNAYNIPILRISVDGKSQIADWYYKENIDFISKQEGIVTISSNSSPATSGWVSIFPDGLDIIHQVFLEAPYLPAATPIQHLTLRMVVEDEDTLELVSQDSNIQGPQIMSYDDSHGNRIKDILLKTNSDTSVSVRFSMIER